MLGVYGSYLPAAPVCAAAGLVLSLAAPALALADTYYVAPSGDDSAGGDEADPWQSLQHAADTVGPGDRVVVREGNYEGFQLQTSGTSSEPIEFVAEDGATVDRDNPYTDDGINLDGASHVILEGFRVEGTSRAGVRAMDCEGVTIRDIRADENGVWGILTSFCDDLLIEGNETSRSGVEHGIYVGNTCRDPVVTDNVVWGNELNGIHLNGDAHAGDEGVISGARIEGNIVYENGQSGGSGINADGLQDAVIASNLLYDNGAAGISLYAIDGGGPSSGNVIAHNTVVMPDGARPALQIRDGSTDNEVVNNLFVHEDPSSEAILVDEPSLSGLEADYNAGTTRYRVGDDGSPIDLDAWREHTGQGEHSFSADKGELFVDPAANDYALALDSPASGVDAATPEVVTADLEGRPHDACGGNDLGAIACGGGDLSSEEAGPDDPHDDDGAISSAELGADGCSGGGAPAAWLFVAATCVLCRLPHKDAAARV